MNPTLETDVMPLYRALDDRTATFRHLTGLSCPPGCGACCRSPNVEATVAELIPLARELFRTGEADAILNRLERDAPPHCILYEPDPADAAQGRCGRYPFRAVVCRLFGFAACRGKDGQPRLSTCKVMAAAAPEATAHARGAVAAGLPAPIFADCAAELAGLAPVLGVDRFPINEALRRAILAVGLRLQLSGPAGPTDTPEGTTPTAPTRAA